MAGEDNFFSRWSRRKVQAQQAVVTAEVTPPVAAPLTPEPAVSVASPVSTRQTAEPPPTLDEAERLTATSDFSRFVARDVDPAVKNTALKKLFADPHFNVMDGLDIYIDDYGKPDPLRPGVLEMMSQSAFLGLFTDAPAAPGPAATPAASQAPAPEPSQAADPQAVPPEPPALPDAPAAPTPDEDPDLRLQPHDAAGRPGPEAGAGAHAGGPH